MPLPRSMRGCDDLCRWRDVAVLEPLDIVVLRGFLLDISAVRYENLKSGVRGDARVAARELFAIVHQIKVKPGVLRYVDHHYIDRVHCDVPEIDGAPFQAEEIAPEINTLYILFRVAVHRLYVGTV